LTNPVVQKYVAAYAAMMASRTGGAADGMGMAEGYEYSDYSYNYVMEDPEAYGFESNWDFSFETISGFDPVFNDYFDYFWEPDIQTPTQEEFNTQIRDSGFVGSERFLDNIGLNFSLVSDPVNILNGEFYVNDEDLVLNGPFPLSLRRIYSSRNTADNELGYGWTLNMFPYLTLAHQGKKIYYVTEDGSVISYLRDGDSTNWFPDLNLNKALVNQNRAGQALSANMLTSRITAQTVGTNSYYRIHLPNGSIKTYLGRKFRKANVDRDRPYLTQWMDNRGNTLTFSYGEDSSANDFGKIRRIESSGGNSLVLYYNKRGHISEALSSDGKRVRYLYELTTGDDLIGVVRPDGSQVSYGYERQPVPGSLSTNYVMGWTSVDTGNGIQLTRTVKGFNIITNAASTHRIIAESKPDGRFLQNFYDTQGRVTQQWATVGLDLRPIRTATFVYSNDFVRAGTNPVTGYTLIMDVFGNTNRYDYTSNLITRITDPLNQSIVQEWYGITNGNGAYPRSLKSRTDKRGLKNEFVYDSQGNVVTNITTGADLTGDGVTKAVFSYTYNTNLGLNVLLSSRDPMGRIVERVYDPTYTRLPSRIISYEGDIPVVTNAYFYTNAVTQTVYVTNRSYGLLWRTVNAWLSSDAATNDCEFDGRGLVTKTVQHSSTGDPDFIRYYYHNSRGDLVELTNAAGTTTRFAYDEAGRITAKEIYAASQHIPLSWEYTYYNENGEVVWADGPRFDPEDYVWRDYDGGGHVSQQIVWRSRARADGSGVEAESGDSLYATTFSEYDPFGNLVKVTDSRGNFTRMHYDVLGQLTRSVSYDSAGKPLTSSAMAYEPGGQVSVSTNAVGGVTRTFYTSSGKLMRQENPDGSIQRCTYYPDGRIKREYLSNGNYWETVYDDVNRIVRRTFSADPLNTESRVYDRRGNLILTTNAVGAVYTSLYDGLGRLKFAAGPPTVSGVCTQRLTAYFYDATGESLVVSNALGEKTITTFDPLGRTIFSQVRTANGSLVRVTSNSYAADHHSTLSVSGSGSMSVTNRIYTDTFGKAVLLQSFPESGVIQYSRMTYDVVGNLVASQDELNQVTRFTYDGLNRMITNTLPDGTTFALQYDAAGAITNRIMPGGLAWSAAFDNAGRMLSENETGGTLTARTSAFSYYTSGPYVGRLRTVTDGRGVTSTNIYDDLLRLERVDCTGTQPEHRMHLSYDYDRRGLVTALHHYYDADALPSTTVTRNWSNHGSLAAENVKINGTTESDLSHRWDAAGRRAALFRTPGFGIQGLGLGASNTFGYRADGLTTSVAANGRTYSFDYGTNGLLMWRSNAFRTLTVNQRDGRGRVRQQTTVVGATTPLLETLHWRANSTLDDYSAQRSTFMDFQDYAYNNRGQLTNDTLKPSAAIASVNTAYDFDSAGAGVLISRRQTFGLTNRWQIGSLDSLLRVQTETNMVGGLLFRASGLTRGAASVTAMLDGNAVAVSYDSAHTNGNWCADLQIAAGSHTLTTTAHHPSGQYHPSTNSTFTVVGRENIVNSYDGAGNVTNRVFGDGRLQSLTWDAFGRLMKVMEKSGAATNYIWTAVYDGLGRRLRTTFNPGGTNSPGSLTIDSWFDPMVEFQEIAVEVNGLRTWKVMGPDVNGTYGGMQGVGGLEATVRESDGQTTPALNDHFGNVLATISGSTVNWNAIRVNGYGPIAGYKAPLLSLSTTLADSLLWRNRRIDPSGLYYLGARYYDPVACRFISPDPLGHAASMDLYSAFNGDPVNRFDPDGRDPAFTFGMPNISTGLTPQQELQASRQAAPYVVAFGAGTLTAAIATPVLAGWGLSGGALAFTSGGLAAGYSDLGLQGTQLALGSQTSYNPNQTAIMVGIGGVLGLGGHVLGEVAAPFINGTPATSFPQRVQQVVQSDLFQSRAAAAGATSDDLAQLSARLATYGNNMVIGGADGGFATATRFSVSQNSLLSTLDQRIAHEAGHVLDDIGNGIFAREANMTFSEFYRAEAFAYRTQYGFNPVPLTAFNAGMQANPLLTWGAVGATAAAGYGVSSWLFSGNDSDAAPTLSKH
jgi:RHS repeat-associated protein